MKMITIAALTSLVYFGVFKPMTKSFAQAKVASHSSYCKKLAAAEISDAGCRK